MRVLILFLMCVALAGCDRYVDTPQCNAYFKPGDLGGWGVDTKGLATDPRTGLRWFRCNAGERFMAGSCTGTAEMLDLASATAYARDFSAASGHTWRLPTVDEMRRLRQTQCQNPAINTQVFPSVLTEKYWSSDASPYGDWLGCSFYAFNGNAHCRDLTSSTGPFWLVLDAPRPPR